MTVHPKISYKVEFYDHLWLPFINQPQTEKVIITLISFDIYTFMVIKWNNGISENDKIRFNG